MKIKKIYNFLILILFIVLLIDRGYTAKSGTSSALSRNGKSSTTATPPSTDTEDSTSLVDDAPKKPHHKSGSDSVVTTTTTTTTDGSGSGSTKSLGEIEGREIIECNGTQSLEYSSIEMSGFYRVASGDFNPYQCLLKRPATNAPTKKGYTNLVIDNTKGKKVSCSEIEITNNKEGFNYGTFQITANIGSTVGTVTQFSITSKDSCNGNQYYDAYISIKGGAKSGRCGYHSGGTESSNTFVIFNLPENIFDSDQNITIYYTSLSLQFYIGGLEIGSFAVPYVREKAPEPNFYFRVSYLQDVNGVIKSKDGKVSATFVKDFSFIAGPCFEESETQGWDIPKAYLDYFTGNCTTYKPYTIFNDTLNEDWKIKSRGNYDFQDTVYKRIGMNIAFGFNSGQTLLRFVTDKSFSIHKHKYLIFWINGGDRGGQNLWISATYKNHIVAKLNLNDFVIGGLQKTQWFKVIVKMDRFQVQDTPKKPQLIDGFMFQPSYDAFMDMVYFDDIMFSNGSRCMEFNTALHIYKNGNFSDMMDANRTVGNVHTSTALKYKNQPTIEYQILKTSVLQVNFLNGSMSIEDFDALTFNVHYYPDPLYISGNAVDAVDTLDSSKVLNSLRLLICLMESDGVGTFPCLSLSSYVGGRFPTNRWFNLNIPWNDLSVDFEGAQIGGFIIKTPDDFNQQDHQGVLYISSISATHNQPPPVQHLLDSHSLKLVSNFNLTCSLLLILLISFLLI